MRILLCLVLLTCLVSPAVALQPQGLGVSLDCGIVQDFILGQGSRQLNIDARVRLAEDFQVRVPFAATFAKGSGMLEAGVCLVYYPWEKGPFMGMSLFQVGFTTGCTDMESLINLNEILVGWTFELGHGLFVEPSVSIRDPSGTFSEEYSRIKGAFPCYTTFRAHVAFGWIFWR